MTREEARKQLLEFVRVFENPLLDETANIALSARTGEWIPNYDGSWNCSECGLRVLVYAKGNYCPNCGADMRGDTE